MKQSKISFTTSKRTASAAGLKKATAQAVQSRSSSRVAPVASPREEERAEVKKEDINEAEDETETAKVVEEEDEETEDVKLCGRKSISTNKTPAMLLAEKDADAVKKPELLPKLNIKDVRWRRLFEEARAKRSNLPLVHGNNQNQFHQILRVFDLNYDYGPCMGVTRLERWERANALGLNPPPEVRDILLTREGVENKDYSECVFYGEV